MSPIEDGKSCSVCGMGAGECQPSPHHLLPGTVLEERYLLGRVLGEGGFGITYIGRDLRLDVRVAIKEYFPSNQAVRHAQISPEVNAHAGAKGQDFVQGREKFLQEARAMAMVHKLPEIVGVRDFFETNNTAYIVMDYVEGTTFRELVRLRGGRIPAGELFNMMEPLFFALEAMHEQGLIHRDISPDNLMLEKGKIRLLDFGCARESVLGTETMTVALKHGFAPIEQYQRRGQGPWTDVYGLCATLYYCLTGEAPAQALDRLYEDELVLPGKLGADLTENQEKALLYGMGVRPRMRYQNVHDLYAALYAGAPAPVTGTGGRRAGRSLRAALCGAGAVLVILLLLAFRNNAADFSPADATEEVSGSVLYLAEADGDALREAVEGDAEAVVWDGEGCIEITGETLTLTKPLRIGKNASVELAAYLRVEDGGMITLEGEMENNGFLQISGSGLLSVEAGGVLCGSSGIWLEQGNNFLVKEDGLAELSGHRFSDTGYDGLWYMTAGENELFVNAAHVTTEKELKTAQEKSYVRAIVIEEDITLSSQTRYFDKNVLIREGVTVTAADSRDRSLCFAGDVLINYGTITGTFQTGDWTDDGVENISHVINYGSIGDYCDIACDGNIINFGSVVANQAQIYKANLYNMGEISHTGEHIEKTGSYLDMANRLFVNLGELRMDDAAYTGSDDVFLTFSRGVEVINHGRIAIFGNSYLENRTRVRGYGVIAEEDSARLHNRGIVTLDYAPSAGTAASLLMSKTAQLNNEGVMFYSAHSRVEFADAVTENSGTILAFCPADENAGARRVSNEGELRAALADDTAGFVLAEDDIALTSELVVTKELAIAPEKTLETAGNDITVQGKNACICYGSLALSGGALTVQDAAAVCVRQISDCGGLAIETEGRVMVMEEELAFAPEASVSVDSGGWLVSMSSRLEHADVSIAGGVWSSLLTLELAGSRIDIGERGSLMAVCSYLQMDRESEIANNGYFTLTGWIPMENVWQGRFLNYGQAEFAGSTLCLASGGELCNDGAAAFKNAILTGEGRFENAGTVSEFWNDYNEGPVYLLDRFGGSYSGNAVVRE
ncbi:MAG: serine/threonine protein kinase [Roseburia sp.]|nr:serine/threonine protein kinase [Roseburia sp.]